MASLNTAGVVDTLKAGVTGKVTADNIDGRTLATQLRLSTGNKDLIGDHFSSAKIPLCGDQLVRVRMKSAKGLMKGAHTAQECLEMFDPVIIEMFHTQQDFRVNIFLFLYIAPLFNLAVNLSVCASSGVIAFNILS